MSKKPADPLHSKTEGQLPDSTSIQAPPRSAADLLADLHVHQIELEMQNEQLRQSRSSYTN